MVHAKQCSLTSEEAGGTSETGQDGVSSYISLSLDDPLGGCTGAISIRHVHDKKNCFVSFRFVNLFI